MTSVKAADTGDLMMKQGGIHSRTDPSFSGQDAITLALRWHRCRAQAPWPGRPLISRRLATRRNPGGQPRQSAGNRFGVHSRSFTPRRGSAVRTRSNHNRIPADSVARDASRQLDPSDLLRPELIPFRRGTPSTKTSGLLRAPSRSHRPEHLATKRIVWFSVSWR